jgi:alcohol dehydrogenase class IV
MDIFFFNTLKLPRTLKEYGIDETHLKDMAIKAESEHLNSAIIPLTADEVMSIYNDCLK